MTLFSIFRGTWIAAASLWVLATGFLSAQAPAAGEDIRGPKALVEIARPPQPLPASFWLGIAAGVLLLAMAALWWWRRRRRRQVPSPEQTARADLTDLAVQCETMTSEAFANRSAQIIRQYLEDRFGLAAPRRTTEEFLGDLTHDEGSPVCGQRDPLRSFLLACDLAKFAALPLDSGARAGLVEAAAGFITATAAPVTNKTTGGSPP
jgi:hypothetical protein